ncbi:MAG TPA: MATE family efflux transporter [Candidatus Gallacutalibacter stercoravium]|nr:MATE family efflux transporter [Candidatus Gallacutalibacter stercoravium]
MRLFQVQKLLRGSQPVGALPSERDVLARTIHIAWPSILESFLVSLVGMIDTVMVSGLGTYAIAAVGLTTQPKFIGLAIFLSLNVAVSALVARRRGENDRESANKVLAQAIVIVLLLTLVISVLCVVFADPIIRMAGSAEDTHADAVSYFRVIMGGMVFNVLSLVINAAQRGAGNTKIAMRTNIVSNLVNMLFNYLLIEGHFGFPRLGVTGAAVATVIGTVFACGMSIASILRKDSFLDIRLAKHIRFDKKTLGTIANIGSSTLAEQVFLRIGFLIYSIIVANLGTVAFAAHQIGMNLMSISFSFGDGLSVASVTLVGQSLGAKRPDMAKVYGGVCQRLGIVFAVVLSIIFVSLGRPIFSLFSNEEAILSYGEMIMSLLAVVVFLQISQVVFSGCLRGAGDTRYTALVSLISVAVVRPGLGWLFCYPLQLGLFGAWLGLAVDQMVRFLMTWVRFRKGKWTSIKI